MNEQMHANLDDSSREIAAGHCWSWIAKRAKVSKEMEREFLSVTQVYEER